MIASYHNHTLWSDGKSDFASVLQFAESGSVDALGISDHFCIYPNGSSPSWSIDPSQVHNYISEIKSRDQASPINLLVGLEIDWFWNHHEIVTQTTGGLDLDYRIGSLHHVDEQPFDQCFAPSKSPEEKFEAWKRYWMLEANMAQSGLFDMVAHIDIPKRLGYFPEDQLENYIANALDAIADNGLVVELNTAGFELCDEAYASPKILRMCKAREIPVTLSADGHEPSRIAFEFERGLEVLREAGHTRITRFSRGERWFEALDTAHERTSNL